MDYKDKLIKKVHELYLGNTDIDEFLLYYRRWAKKYNQSMPKEFKVISDYFAYNDPGDIIPVVGEDKHNIYYYDSCNRWCYVEKSKEGKDFKYVKPFSNPIKSQEEDADYMYGGTSPGAYE
jgi:hypothetical protein